MIQLGELHAKPILRNVPTASHQTLSIQKNEQDFHRTPLHITSVLQECGINLIFLSLPVLPLGFFLQAVSSLIATPKYHHYTQASLLPIT